MKSRCALPASFRAIISASFFALLLFSPSRVFAAGPPFLELTVADETVPPGGMLQMKVQVTEPKPISKGGQKARFNANFLGPIQGIHLFSPLGDASGTALLSKGAAYFSLSSPLSSMGDAID